MRRAVTPAPAFDVPGDAGELTGMAWDGATLLTALRLEPTVSQPIRLRPAGEDETPGRLSLGVVAAGLQQFGIPLREVTVITHALRRAVGTPAGEIYGELLGPLPAAAHREVLVTLRLAPADCPVEVIRRGGGPTGSLRTAAAATARLAGRLRRSGLAVSVLPAAALAPVRRELIEAPAHRLTAANLTAAALPHRITELWRTDAVASTVALSLAPAPDAGLRLAGSMRLIGAAHPRPPGTAVEAGEPVGLNGAAATETVAATALPVAGCGVLVGADPDGCAIAVPPAAPGAVLRVNGDDRLAAALVARAVGTGVSVTVASGEPRRWQPLVDAIGDPARLRLGARPGLGPGARLAVYDRIPPPAPEPGETAAGRLFIGVAGPAADIDITAESDRLLLRCGDDSVALRRVSTPAEWRLTGFAAT